MNRLKTLSLLLAILILVVTVTAGISAEKTTDKPNITTRQLESQTVLYTIHRGSYEKMGKTIGSLYALGIKNKIWPRGQLYCVYLNNPKNVSSEHYLIEIRIPVDKEALKLTGTLGEMTDIKTLPAMEVAVAIKSAGQADPGSIYGNLYKWIHKEGYAVSESPREKFLNDAKSGNYAQMKSEIMMPIKKISSEE